MTDVWGCLKCNIILIKSKWSLISVGVRFCICRARQRTQLFIYCTCSYACVNRNYALSKPFCCWKYIFVCLILVGLNIICVPQMLELSTSYLVGCISGCVLDRQKRISTKWTYHGASLQLLSLNVCKSRLLCSGWNTMLSISQSFREGKLHILTACRSSWMSATLSTKQVAFVLLAVGPSTLKYDLRSHHWLLHSHYFVGKCFTPPPCKNKKHRINL